MVFTLGRVTALWLVLRTLAKFGTVPIQLGRILCIEKLTPKRRPSGEGWLPPRDHRRFRPGGRKRESVADLGFTALGLCDEDEPSEEVPPTGFDSHPASLAD